MSFFASNLQAGLAVVETVPSSFIWHKSSVALFIAYLYNAGYAHSTVNM